MINKPLYEKLKPYEGFNYEMQYIDYPENEWTIPVKLTTNRMIQLCDDYSVKSVNVIHDTGNIIFNAF